MKSLLIAFVFAAVGFGATPTPEPRQPRPVGKMVFDSDKGKISMDKYKGKVTVLMFFHTECSHCITTAQNLERALAERHHDFEVVGVAVDEVPQRAVPEFVKRHRLSYPVGWVGKDDFFKYTDLPPNTRPFIPVLLFIDKDFQINRQYAQNHIFFTASGGEYTNTLGVVRMLLVTAPGKAKDLPRRQEVPQQGAGAPPKKQ
jgi:thiol-disulfide isomerase/thioredoxin